MTPNDDQPAKEPRYWQTDIMLAEGKKGTLTIESEKGRSDNNERIFVLQTLGSVRALEGWKFSFIGSPREMPAFSSKAVADVANQTRYWVGEPIAAEPVGQLA